MRTPNIPLDKAELLSMILEALLYGFSLLMFGATLWVLLFQRYTHQVNHKMLIVACLLLLGSTLHLVIDIIRIMEGLISRKTHPGGPVAYFSNVSHWTFVAKNYVFTAQTLIGDGVVLYRCYVAWQSKLVMILPALLWCATLATGIGSPYTASIVRQSEVFGGTLSQWIASFWATALATNLLTTLLLVCRIWYVDRKVARLRGHGQSQLRPILHALIDAGAIYTLTLIMALIFFASQNNGQYVVLAMVTPIISITFYMVIIRIGFAARAHHVTHLSMGDNVSAEQRWRTQVHVTKWTERDYPVERPSRCLTTPNSSNESEVKPDALGDIEAV